MHRKQSASIQDVAKEAGISPQTVSRVANNSDKVRPETKKKVLSAMQKLGYRPNYAARALKRGHFNDVGVVLYSMAEYGNTHILDSILSTANANHYATTIQIMDGSSPHPLYDAVERMQVLPVDGIIVIMERCTSDFEDFQPPADFPVVLISERPSPHCVTVDTDQYDCSTQIVNYLLGKGHKTVYHIAGPIHSSQAAERRLAGWADALYDADITDLPEVHYGDWHAQSGYDIALELAKRPDCTAVYAANDQMAYGAMLGFKAAGKRVPEDISVMGIDDSLGDYVPQLELTTLRPRFDEIGRRAFDTIIGASTGRQAPKPGVKIGIPASLIERGSVRAIR
ncbi:LacI family DNA-binding transcriptional regulator [Bifidobacterium sp. ESL0775]|uniref:LacI family DNA-binding transcriptional regulator n=1 Tax=Bifidobacterium sp. ESL0775 TaxID=2983230 RepID=UPI0023F91D08|nr:LacI family DNA-binding transcriptional regulator [Bifidobacterium sp. ESL0775]WEV68870.1 LacI family DNA-binding transcriptional regulator [Bifidobacterium sp. ESL0775]